jgi:hypothetical protein
MMYEIEVQTLSEPAETLQSGTYSSPNLLIPIGQGLSSMPRYEFDLDRTIFCGLCGVSTGSLRVARYFAIEHTIVTPSYDLPTEFRLE